MGLVAAASSGPPGHSAVSGREHRDTGPVASWGQEGPALPGMDPLSPRVGSLLCPWCNLQAHNTPSHAKNSSNFLLKNPQVQQDDRTEGENIVFTVSSPLSPFMCFPSLFCSACFILARLPARGRAGNSLVWQKSPLLSTGAHRGTPAKRVFYTLYWYRLRSFPYTVAIAVSHTFYLSIFFSYLTAIIRAETKH